MPNRGMPYSSGSWTGDQNNQSTIDNLREDVNRLCEKVDRFDTLLRGDDKTGSPGMIGKLQALIDESERRKWWTTPSIGAAITAIAASLWTWISGHRS